MSLEFLVTWKAWLMLAFVLLLSIPLIHRSSNNGSGKIWWGRLVRSYFVSLSVMVLVVFMQSGFRSGTIFYESVLTSYIVLPWVTYFIYPLSLRRKKSGVVLSYIIGSTSLLTIGAFIFLWPGTDGYDPAVVLKNSALNVLDLFVLLLLTGISFYFASRGKTDVTLP